LMAGSANGSVILSGAAQFRSLAPAATWSR
jgi:hypothetical protein